MRRIGAREGVDHVHVALAQARRDLVAEAFVVLLRDLRVDVAPPDPPLGARLADDELVLGRAACVLAGVDDQGATFGETCLAAREGVLVELRGRRMPEDVPAYGDTVLSELVPIGNDRDHSASSYVAASASEPFATPASRESAPRVRGRRDLTSRRDT